MLDIPFPHAAFGLTNRGGGYPTVAIWILRDTFGQDSAMRLSKENANFLQLSIECCWNNADIF
jgi:hypothetical protein